MGYGLKPLQAGRANQSFAPPVHLYGAAAPLEFRPREKIRMLDSSRLYLQRPSVLSALQCVILPWLLFTALSAALAFEAHFQRPWLIYFCCLLSVVILVPLCLLAADAVRQHNEHIRGIGVGRDPTWFLFLFATTLLAWTAGVIYGEHIYGTFTVPFLNLRNMDTYYDVDPSTMPSQQIMDAGRILFTHGASLNLAQSTGFRVSRNVQTFCVAPIAAAPDSEDAQTTYEFWAVGVNCCSGVEAGDFTCGEANNPSAHGGLRLLDENEDERPFYRLAVQQAESAFGLSAPQPIFLTWMQDPVGHVNAFYDRSWTIYLVGVWSYLVFQTFLATAAWTFTFKESGGASGLLFAAGPGPALDNEFLNI